jgi:chaperonin GroES
MSSLPRFTPLGDRVLIRQANKVEQLDSGLFIPQGAQEAPHQGEVLAVGPGRLLANGDTVEPYVKDGDVILFGKYSGQELRLDGQLYLTMKEEDILGVIENQ